jgi:hypothetical protein
MIGLLVIGWEDSQLISNYAVGGEVSLTAVTCGHILNIKPLHLVHRYTVCIWPIEVCIICTYIRRYIKKSYVSVDNRQFIAIYDLRDLSDFNGATYVTSERFMTFEAFATSEIYE